MFNTTKNNNNNKTVYVRKLIIEWQQVKLERTSENMASLIWKKKTAWQLCVKLGAVPTEAQET